MLAATAMSRRRRPRDFVYSPDVRQAIIIARHENLIWNWHATVAHGPLDQCHKTSLWSISYVQTPLTSFSAIVDFTDALERITALAPSRGIRGEFQLKGSLLIDIDERVLILHAY